MTADGGAAVLAQRLRDLRESLRRWMTDKDQADAIPFVCDTLVPQVDALLVAALLHAERPRDLESEVLALGERASRWFADGTRTDEPLTLPLALLCIAGALGALEAHAERPREWEPIETAPKDGTHIVVVTEGGCVVRVKWAQIDDFEAWQAAREEDAYPDHFPHVWDDGVCWMSNSEEMPSDQPKWWQPLPASASGEAKERPANSVDPRTTMGERS